MTENGLSNSYHEHEHDHSKSKRKKKLIKYAIIGVIVKAIFTGIFILAVVHIQSPKLRLGEIGHQTLTFSGDPSSPSFDLRFGAELRIKNPNFFKYEHEATTVSFFRNGVVLGDATVSAGKVGLRSSKEAPISAAVVGNLTATEIGVGVLSLRGMAVMRGKFEIMVVLKKRKNSEMDCFIDINLAMKSVQRLECL